jgi:hypothetical protein
MRKRVLYAAKFFKSNVHTCERLVNNNVLKMPFG